MEAVSAPGAPTSSTGGAHVAGYVLISNLDTGALSGGPGGLLKYEPSTGVLTAVSDPTGIISGLDGMKFNADRSILFGARNSPTNIYQTVVAAITCDNWASATLAFSFMVNCGGSNPSALDLIQNADGSEDLVILCTDGFGPGPYPMQVVRNVKSVVSNQPLSSWCASESAVTAPSTVPTTPPATTTSNSASGSLESVKIFAGVTTAFLLTLALGTVIWNWSSVVENYGCRKKEGDKTRENGSGAGSERLSNLEMLDEKKQELGRQLLR